MTTSVNVSVNVVTVWSYRTNVNVLSQVDITLLVDEASELFLVADVISWFCIGIAICNYIIYQVTKHHTMIADEYRYVVRA